MRRLAAALLLPLGLAACGAESTWAPQEAVQRAVFVSGEQPSVTLFTVVNKRNGDGAHAGLMIDGSQRVMYDGAGTWNHPSVPERNDLHYGITPRMKAFYIDYHARETFDVVEQRVPVSREVADLLIARAQAQGPTPKAFCANSLSDIMAGVPGFEGVGSTMFPNRIRRAFAAMPGVETKVHKDGDPANNHGVLLVQKSEI